MRKERSGPNMLVPFTIPIPLEAIFRIERLADMKRCSRSAMARELLLAGLVQAEAHVGDGAAPKGKSTRAAGGGSR
jgi:hypothetical protein